jgi:hypothetical protein
MSSIARPFFFVAFASACVVAVVTVPASAAPPWVERPNTLPSGDVSFDLGVGVAHHRDPAPFDRPTGSGLNFEFGIGLTRKLELAFRTGARFGDDGRITHADEAGRLFDRQTFGTRGDPFANPEVRFRGNLVRERVFELALEGRAILPIEDHSRFGAMFGVPMAFHAGHSVRVDLGVFVPVVFEDPTDVWISVPVDVWIQVSRRVFLGPMTGIRHYAGRRDWVDRTDVSLGFGFGLALTQAIDMKAMALFPEIDDREGARTWSLGFGFQFRVE